jgi:hypothetical protein
MSHKTYSVRMRKADIEKLRCECRLVFLKDNPDANDEELSDAFMLHRIIEFYLH